eukprot:scaffold111187_cov54-Phaeocystis_antarctica.AAC.1
MITRDMLVQLALALTLCIIATIQPLLMELAKRGNGGHTPFHTPSAMLTRVTSLRAARTGGTGQLAPGERYCTYAVRVPASGVPYVPRAVWCTAGPRRSSTPRRSSW